MSHFPSFSSPHTAVVRCILILTATTLAATAVPSPARGRTFEAGSLIIPMDLTYQDTGMLQAFGLVAMLVRHGVPVHRVIAAGKLRIGWHADCAAVSRVLYDDSGRDPPDDPPSTRDYYTGPFVIDAADAVRAMPILKAWNEPRRWVTNPWAARSVFRTVSIHEATHPFDGNVSNTLVHVPRPAILADSREGEYARILRAAGIFQSDGAEFSDAPCLPGSCGPGTARPEFLPLSALMGDATPCFSNHGTAPGAHFADTTLFDAQGRPRFALVAAAGWTAEERETITCQGGVPCVDAVSTGNYLPWVCFDPPLALHGHRVVNYLTAFSHALGGLFFMGEAAYALENAIADPYAPVFDRDAIGHFVSQVPPLRNCPCEDTGLVCFPLGCRDATGVFVDCCLSPVAPARGAGVVPGGSSDRDLSILSASHPPFQIDGSFHPSTGALGLFSPVHPDGTEVVMTPAHTIAHGATPGVLASERVLLLADFRPSVGTPVSSNPDTQVSRLFLNALFASEWSRHHDPVEVVVSPTRTCFGLEDALIHQVHFSVGTGTLPRLEEVTLEVEVPEGITVQACSPTPEATSPKVRWVRPSVTERDQFSCVFSHQALRKRELGLALRFRDAGVERHFSDTFLLALTRSPDTDGDGLIDCEDPRPTVPTPCGDLDHDWYDDCSGDFVDWNDDDGCDCGDCGDSVKTDRDGDLFIYPSCRAAPGHSGGPSLWLAGLFALLALAGLSARRRRSGRGDGPIR